MENQEDLQKQIDELRKDQEKLRGDLVQQEHRPVKAILNLYTAFSEDDGSEKSKSNKRNAIFAAASVFWKWRIRTLLLIGGGGGLIALLTLWVGYSTLKEFQRQNNEFIKQNQLFQEQNRQQLVSTNGQMVSDLIGDLYAEWKKDSIHIDSLWKVPTPLLYRVVTVSDALIPDDLVSTKIGLEKKVSHLLSKERGILFQAVADLKIRFPLRPNPDFSKADIRGYSVDYVNLSEVNLSGAFLEGVKLSRVDFSKANLKGAYLNSSDSSYTSLTNVIFREADLREANLSHVDMFMVEFNKADLRGADLRGAGLTRVYLSDTKLEGTKVSSLDFFKIISENKGSGAEELEKRYYVDETSQEDESGNVYFIIKEK
jgi:hypothetical protein